MSKKYSQKFIHHAEGKTRELIITGRTGHTLEELITRGDAGLATIESPALRISEYVRRLRHDFDIEIETLKEEHGGMFAGWHGRYVLRSDVRLASEGVQ